MISLHRSFAALGVIVFAVSCSSTDPINNNTGGSPPVGTGGAKASGGTSAQTGGTSTTTGGTTQATGGAVSGGSGGGTSTSGGSSAKGGASATGGSNSGGAGGSTSVTGGTSAGGTSATGGAGPGSGGGGGKASGGSSSGGSGGNTGGATGMGGTTSTGGSGPQGGTGPLGASGYPAPGNGGVAKPSGTPGAITVLPWAGFKGAVSYTFDDTNQTQINRYAEMNALGVRFTFFMQTGKQNEFGNSVWSQAKTAGHELANHTRTHSGTASDPDIKNGQSDIQGKFQVTPVTMAAPNGTDGYADVAKNNRYLINRGVGKTNPGFNDPISSQYNLSGWLPAGGNADYGSVTSAVSGGKWIIVCIHGWNDQGATDGAYQATSFSSFTSHVTSLKNSGNAWIDTVENIGSYWVGSKSFAAATTTTSGSDKTWTWTLPANFPKGNYLRVKVDGGTLKQNGTTLPWDPHGYYEISLDALSVTLSP
ncbi:MAG TPA: polysaccharide deacetylase family protein [Polyangiaceae bacterium]|nr:polysaccharide deacetylase family protein [Polyangiaceae bacterium]